MPPSDISFNQVKILRTLFLGREDAYGLESSSTPITIREPLTDALILDHLTGSKRIGGFLISKDNKVKNACIDLDRDEPEKLQRIISVLIEDNFFPYLERSKSKGYHIWIFFDDLVEAAPVRKVLTRILKDARIENVEIFPKQDSVNSNNGLGNYVFLPLQGQSIKENKTVFVNVQFKPYEDQWAHLAKIHLTKAENVLSLAGEIPGEPISKLEYTEMRNEGGLDVAKYLTHYNIRFNTKEDNQRTFYLLNRCLFSDNHTTKDNLGDSAIVQDISGKVTYQCFHAHCKNRTWADARNKISGGDSLNRFIKKQNPYYSVLLDADKLITLSIPPREMILTPWLYLQQIVLIYGWRGVGKTMFTISCFDAITRGEAIGPWQNEICVPCLYVDGEMALYDMQERVKILATGKNIPRKMPLRIYSDAQANLSGLPRANLNNAKWRTDMKNLMLDNGIKLVAFDNIASLAPGLDENSKKDWDPINQFLIDLRFSGITVTLLHHENRTGGQRGASAREDNIDMSISLSKPQDYQIEDGCRFIVKFKKNRIATKEMSLLQDHEFKLVNSDGRYEWTWTPVRKKNQIQILRLLDQGVSQTDTAAQLNVSKAFVSKVKSQAIKNGQLTDNGKLTKEGSALVSSFFDQEDEDEF